MSDAPYAVARLDEIEAVGQWLPIRAQLGIQAFGVNAWRPRADDTVIPEHAEEPTGHEELYYVLEGHATFTVGEKELDAPAGTFVFVRDPTVNRKAVAHDPETLVLSMGAKPGEAFTPRSWEINARVFPLFDAGEFEQAYEILSRVAEEDPTAGGVLYNLACAESRLGRTEPALEHLRQAIAIDQRFGEYAQTDPDLEAIRSEAGFPSA